MAKNGFGVTIGSYSLRAVRLRAKGEGFVVQRVFADRLNDDTRKVAGRALAARGFRGQAATVGLTGRDVIIRYSQVPPVADWRLRNLMKYEVEEVGTQSGGDVSADYRKLNLPDPEAQRTEDTILVALARNSYLDRQIRSLSAGGISLGSACPNSVALFNAFAVNATYTEEETTLLVNIGAEDLDVAIQQNGELLFARNAVPGGMAFTEAIQTAFSTSQGKAEKMKLAKADVTPKGQAKYPDPTSEKVANALISVAGQMAQLIQSTLMIARAQSKLPDLKVDRVMLAGGGASLKGLDLYLHQAMGIPVEHLDPFAISDLSQLTDDEREMVERAPHEFAVAVGLAQAEVSQAAFNLAVLPAGLKRRRDFTRKGIFTVLSAVAAGLILVVIYQGRVSASAAAKKELAKVRRMRSDAESADERLRKELVEFQDRQLKHAVLADVAAPGALLAKTLRVLEDNLAERREVYLDAVQLRVDQQGNEFAFYRPKSSKNAASGYEIVRRQRYFQRDAEVLVRGRISGTQRPDAIYQAFFEGCHGNAEGLRVETVTGWKRGRRGDDGKFEIRFLPGIQIQTVNEEGTESGSVTLHEPRLDDPDEPEAILGRRPDGRLITILKKNIRKNRWRELQTELTK